MAFTQSQGSPTAARGTRGQFGLLIIAFIAGLTGCDPYTGDLFPIETDTGTSIPPGPTQKTALLSCVCPADVGPGGTYCKEIQQGNVDAAQTHGLSDDGVTCTERLATDADVGREFCGACGEYEVVCVGSDSEALREDDALRSCRNLGRFGQGNLDACLNVNDAETMVVRPDGTEVSFDDKCVEICNARERTVDLLTARQAGDPCRTPRLRTHVRCTDPRNPLTGGQVTARIRSCPSQNIDPPGLTVAVDSARSTAHILVYLPDDSTVIEDVSVPISGEFYLDRDHCPSGACPINVVGAYLNTGGLTILGFGLSRIGIGLGQPNLAGTLGADGALAFPPGDNWVGVRGTFAGAAYQGNVIVNAGASGRLDDSLGSVSLSGAVARPLPLGGRIELRVNLTGLFTNRPPRPAFTVPATAECTDASGATVTADATGTTDPDGNADVVEYAWFTNDTPAAHGLTSQLRLPLGTSTVNLRATDARGLLTWDVPKVVEVRDTTAPSLTSFAYSGPLCLWSPNHKYVVLAVGRDFRAVVEDRCDPGANLVISSGTSNQPDDGIGDGSTTGDVVVFADHVCLRAERQGNTQGERVYTLRLHARDASGNESDPTVTIRVAHDQSAHDCTPLAVHETAEAGDARCMPAPPAPPATYASSAPQPERPPAGSCQATTVFDASTVLIFGLLLLHRRRNGARRKCA